MFLTDRRQRKDPYHQSVKGLRNLIWSGFLFSLFFAPAAGIAQTRAIHYFFTTADFRAKFHEALITWSINNNLAATLDHPDGRYDFESAFWPMELIHYKSGFVKERLIYAFEHLGQCDLSFQRGLLEVVYTNWPDSFQTQVVRLLKTTRHPKIFALCAEYLWRGGERPDYKSEITRLLKQKFRNKQEHPIIKMLSERLSAKASFSMPSLADLFSPQFAPGLTVLFSFQRPDRKYPGRAIVRKPDGSFVYDSSGQLFSVPQLALSVSNLPFYLTNGNTPQGIYRMSGFAVSNSRFIGPTENIQLSMPFEIPVDSFMISSSPDMDTIWNIKKYELLLPPSWQQYPPVFQSYYAGKAGRTAIIAHGTTIDPNYYKGTTYFPETPSLGCLCTYEEWDAEGNRQRSDQQRLVNAVKEAGNGTGYAVVINLSDKEAAVTVADIERLIN